MNSNQLLFMRKMIYALETGGQVYGNQNYSDFTQPYTNSSSLSDQSGERAITIGAGQWYGPEAKRLLNLIKSKLKFRSASCGLNRGCCETLCLRYISINDSQ